MTMAPPPARQITLLLYFKLAQRMGIGE